MVKKAFFIDRDGVINREIGYLHEAENTVLIPGVPEAVIALHRAGYMAVVVSNQAGVAKGYYPESCVHEVHARIQKLLLTGYGSEAVIDAWYYCPHHQKFTGLCSCRNPEPGMLLKAAADFDIDLSNSFMIGDRISDLQAGSNAGCAAGALVLSSMEIYGNEHLLQAQAGGFMIAEHLLQAVEILLKK